jgi:hypothetical protein
MLQVEEFLRRKSVAAGVFGGLDWTRRLNAVLQDSTAGNYRKRKPASSQKEPRRAAPKEGQPDGQDRAGKRSVEEHAVSDIGESPLTIREQRKWIEPRTNEAERA